ncbi:MAG: T9SS type A sorting domain-containing protein [Flavobacteriia bacterium]|nr:T9SS type A sorting domain-containing protein [Flavobacteriia bacterium]
MRYLFSLTLIVILALQSNAQSSRWGQRGPSFAFPSISGEKYGYMDINHNGTRIISALNQYGPRVDGYCVVMDFDGTQWNELGSPFVGVPNEHLGMDAAIDSSGNRIAILSRGTCFGVSCRGYNIKVYDWNGTTWVQAGDSIGFPNHSLHALTFAMSNDGNSLAFQVETPHPVTNQPFTGFHVVGWNGSNWVSKGGVQPDTGMYWRGYDLTLSNDGNSVILGNYLADYNGNSNAGTVRVLDFDGTNWIQRGSTLHGFQANANVGSVTSLSGNGNTLLLTAPGNNAARAYRWNDSAWVQKGSTFFNVPPTGTSGGGLFFLYENALSYSGDTLALFYPGFQVPHMGSQNQNKIFAFVGSQWVQIRDSITSQQYGANPSPIAIAGNGRNGLINESFNWQLFKTPRWRVLDTAVCNATIQTSDTIISCSSWTTPNGLQTFTADTVLDIPYFSINGCDSIVSTSVDIKPSYNITLPTEVKCGPFTWGGNSYNPTNATTLNLVFNGTSIHGCDSIVNAQFEYYPAVPDFILRDTGCVSYTWTNGITYTQSIFGPSDTFTTVHGCDSVVILDLIVYPEDTNQAVLQSCDPFTWIDGVTYTSSMSGVYFTLSNIAGCDSVVELDLTITTLDTVVSYVNGVLSSGEGLAQTYQWYDCDKDSILVGQTNQDFQPNANGTYAVALIKDGCVDTSMCYSVADVNIDELDIQTNHFYPIPASTYIQYDGLNGPEKVVLIAFNGIEVAELISHQGRFSLPDLTSGIYFVKWISSDGKTHVERIVVN